jgi:HEAT repeat protein
MRLRIIIAGLILVITGMGTGCQKSDQARIDAQIENLNSTSHDVREAAITALVEIGKPAVESLLSALESTNKEVQISAAKSLGRIGDTRAIQPLIELLTESFDVDLMFEAAMALSSLDEKEACDELKKLKKSSNPIISKLVKKLLKENDICK